MEQGRKDWQVMLGRGGKHTLTGRCDNCKQVSQDAYEIKIAWHGPGTDRYDSSVILCPECLVTLKHIIEAKDSSPPERETGACQVL